ncbi:hypothetical protein, partial [Hydrogenophaga sp.]|uniref:hypothetical protein n=1 Tax=Hydrogenophaga sp. TaxID=1904254 RepID=UPI0016AB7DD9
MAFGAAFGDYISEWAFNTYIWPEGAATPGSGSAGGLSLSVSVSSEPIVSLPEAIDIAPPPDAPTRISTDYLLIETANAHAVTVNAGGTVWDAFAVQKGQPGGFSDWGDFQQAVAVSNPGISDLSQIAAGTTLYLPERHADGSITYHYSGGAAITANVSDGTYHMVIPNAEGGQTIYSRSYVGDVDGDDGSLIAQYDIRQISSDATGEETYRFEGLQTGLQGEIRAQSEWSLADSDSDGNGSYDLMTQTTHLSAGFSQVRIDNGMDGQWNHESLHTGFASYDLFDQYQRNQAEYQLSRLNSSGQLDNNYWNQFTQQSSAWM